MDAETGEVRGTSTSRLRLAAAYANAWREHDRRLEQFCGRYDMGYLRADTERPFEEIVMEAFRQGRFVA